jgi:hypothetical protein
VDDANETIPARYMIPFLPRAVLAIRGPPEFPTQLSLPEKEKSKG